MPTAAQRQHIALARAVALWAGRLDRPDSPATIGTLAQLLVDAQADGLAVEAADLALAVRLGLQDLAARRPGRSVEVRVPPYGAAQLGTGEGAGPGAGPRHTRGTPPAVVETDPVTFLELVAGRVTFGEAQADHRLSLSGAHTDLTDLFPVA
jgi:hypothetical protein